MHASAAFVHTTTTKETVDLIRESGFTPAERTTFYDIIAEYGEGEYPESALNPARLDIAINAGSILTSVELPVVN